MSDYNLALKRILEHEGGYVNHPDDPGGETNFGVTKWVAIEFGYTGEMKHIPHSVVADIYYKQYWAPIGADQYDLAVAFQIFDAAVNHGVGRASQWAQSCCGAGVDGVIGAKTISKLQLVNGQQFVNEFNSERIRFYTNLKAFSTFGRGWMNRVAGNLDYAAKDLL